MKLNYRRNLAAFASCLALAFCTISCSTSNILIKGNVNNETEKVTLSRIEKVVAESEIDDANNYNMVLKNVKQGYYMLNNRMVYLAPGFDLAIDLSEEKSTVEGKGELENNLLLKRVMKEYDNDPYTDEMADLYQTVEPDGFKEFLKELRPTLLADLSNENLNKKFVISETARTEHLLNALHLNYALLHGYDIEAMEAGMTVIDSFVMTLKPEQYEDPRVAVILDSIMMLEMKNTLPQEVIQGIKKEVYANYDWSDEEAYAMRSQGYEHMFKDKIISTSFIIKSNDRPEDELELIKLDVILDSIKSESLKMARLTDQTDIIIKVLPDHAEAAYNLFNTQASATPRQKEIIENAFTTLQSIVVGEPAAKFVNYKTPDDQNVSLDDLKGKYVYIDVWATWCGPCKKEIPFLQELEKAFHGKDIHFVSMSVDASRDTDKWKKMVKDLGLKGVQIMADNAMDSDFIQAYNIAAIPRFLLIDPKGNLISDNAQRPSDPEIKAYLEALLN